MSTSKTRSPMNRAIKNEYQSPCKVGDCIKQTYLKSGLCLAHNAIRRKSGDPLVPIVSFKNRKYTLPVNWLIKKYTEDVPEEALGNLRAALLSAAADPSNIHRDHAYYLLSDTFQADRIRTYSKIVLLSAISLYHADILPNALCYQRQVGRQVMLMDRSKGAGRFLGVRATDYFGRLIVQSCAGSLARDVAGLVDECPYWWR